MQSTKELIGKSDLISRDLSWLQFNHRVLDQARKEKRNLFEKLKFLAITSSNADEFNMIRVGSLYNYLDFGNDRVDYSGLQVIPFKEELLSGLNDFGKQQNQLFLDLKPSFQEHNFEIKGFDELNEKEQKSASKYFEKTIFPMLTLWCSIHTIPFPF